MKKKIIFIASALATLSIIVIAGYGAKSYLAIDHEHEHEQDPPSLQDNMAMPVKTQLIKSESTMIWREFSGYIRAVNTAIVRPQVSGAIIDIKFQDGQLVEKGEVIYLIDPRPYQALVQQAEADHLSALNHLKWAETELNRTSRLIKSNAIAERVFDERDNEVRIAHANLKAAEARLEQARINLDYTQVKAPISGRISRAEVTLGNLVEAGPAAPLLTTIVSQDGVYVEFDVDEHTYINHIHPHARTQESIRKIPLMISKGKSGEMINGRIHSFDNQIERSSGTIRARGFFANSDNSLIPGMYVRIKLGSPRYEDKILINEEVIGTNQSHKFVYVVNDDELAEYRSIVLGESINGRRVILEGLQEGDQIITQGFMFLLPNTPVKPEPEPDTVEAVPTSELSETT